MKNLVSSQMIRIAGKPLTLILMLIACTSASGQSFMYLKPDFKESATQMSAKRKGISAIGKYEFGPYKIVSGKQGWTKTKGTSNFRGDSKSESETKSTFVFNALEGETINANILYTSTVNITEKNGLIFRLLTDWSFKEVEQREVFVAEYDFSNDTTSKWSLVLTYPIVSNDATIDMEDLMKLFKGEVVSDSMTISIVPELMLENGKKASIFRPMEAYTFQLKGEIIGAVQIIPMNRMAVWIKNDLSDHLKNVIAVSAATMMVRTDQSDVSE